MATDIKRRLARGVAVLTIALGAGHLVQTMSDNGGKKQVAKSEVAEKAKNVETLAAGAETVTPAADTKLAAPRLPAATVAQAPQAAAPAPAVAEKAVAPKAMTQSGIVIAKTTEIAPAAPTIVDAKAEAVDTSANPAPLAPQPQVAVVEACPVTLDLAVGENAMMGLTLVAPCQKNARVVVKHAGLAVTAKTTVTGALFTDLPALESDAKVDVVFADGTAAHASVAVPEVANIRRFAVQWQSDDAFQVHAFEDGSGYDGAGHVSGANPHHPAAGVPAKGGFLTLLGDSTTPLPLLAEVYTYPADPTKPTEVVVEAAVTQTACGREMLGETVSSVAGRVEINDLTVAMPECDAVGDYLVLKNLVADTNIASSD